MKFLITTLTFIFLFLVSNSQDVKTKDGISLGKRIDFIKSCVKGANKKLMNFNGIEIEAEKYCSCVCENLIPEINSWEIQQAAKENKMSDLFMKDDNFKILMNCFEGNYKISDNYAFEKGANSDISMNSGIKNCALELLSDPETKELWTEEMAIQYCSCAIEKLFKSGYTYKDLKEIENENSPIYNEIALPCVTEVLNSGSNKNSSSRKNIYNPEDISGGGKSSTVQLTDYLGNGFKIKITIDGVSRYYLFDTGATDLTIDSETERELLLNGTIKRSDYIGEKEYELADGKTVKGQIVKVSKIKIGEYNLNNVTIAVLKDGALLCGKSFLDKFKKWELNKEDLKLVLYK